MIEQRSMTRREILRLGSLAAAAALIVPRVQGEVKSSGAIDVHAHL